MLSRADDAFAIYLIELKLKELQLRVWLHKGGNRLLVDTICLCDMVTNLRMSDITVEDKHVSSMIIQVGDNAEFVFLWMDPFVLYLDIKCRTLRKVYELPEEDKDLGSIHPFTMIWPPTFPTLKFDPGRFALWPLDDMYNALVKVMLFCQKTIC